MNTAGDAWHEALRRLDKLAEVYTGSARIEEIRSWVERGGDGAAEAVDALTGGLVPDTGQARETGAGWAARPRRFTPEDTLSVAERLGAAEPSGDTGRPPAEPSDAWVIGRFADATAQHGDRTFEMWDDDVHRTSAAALHHHVMHVEDPDPWSWHIYALVRIAYAGSSGDTVQAPDGDQDELGEAARRLDAAAVRVHTGASRVLRWLATDLRDARAAVGADWARPTARALLGTDTTPDRLAWIDTAAETAAVERQARYQETACARRPAEERPDA